MLLLQGQELGACLGDKAVIAKAGQEVICPPSDLVEDLLVHPSPTPRPAGDAPSHLEGCSSYWECELQIVCKAMTESHYIPSIFIADHLIHPNPAPRPVRASTGSHALLRHETLSETSMQKNSVDIFHSCR